MGLCSFPGKLSCHISPRVTLAHKLVGWRDNNHLLLNVSRRRLGDSGGLQERPPRLLAHWSSMERKLRSWGNTSTWVQSSTATELDWSSNALALLKKGQPAAVLHREEAEVFQRLPQVAGAVLQVNSGVCGDIQQPLSLRQPQRTGQGKTLQDHQD